MYVQNLTYVFLVFDVFLIHCKQFKNDEENVLNYRLLIEYTCIGKGSLGTMCPFEQS